MNTRIILHHNVAHASTMSETEWSLHYNVTLCLLCYTAVRIKNCSKSTPVIKVTTNTIITTPCAGHLGETMSRGTRRLQATPLHHPLLRDFHLLGNSIYFFTCFIVVAAHNASLYKTVKFPLLLPPKHILTSLIIHSVHLHLFQAGTNATLTAIQQRFWIPTALGKFVRKAYSIPELSHLPEIHTRVTSLCYNWNRLHRGNVCKELQHRIQDLYLSIHLCHYPGNPPWNWQIWVLRHFCKLQILVSDNASAYTSAARELRQLKSDHLKDVLGRQRVQ